MKFLTPSVLLLQLLGTAPSALALTVDATDPNSLKQASSTTAANMINFYNNRASKDIPGKLDGTWWEGGAMFMALIQYWHWTGDSTYNAAVNEGMIWQAGEHGDYFPSNWSNYLVRETP
jgi:mannan endo-1,6-alpha-mannosidase